MADEEVKIDPGRAVTRLRSISRATPTGWRSIRGELPLDLLIFVVDTAPE